MDPRHSLTACLLATVGRLCLAHTPWADLNSVVLLQAFNWESWHAGNDIGYKWYGIVQSQLDKAKNLGVTDMWLPPMSQSVAPQGYLPSQLCDLDNSAYGNQFELQRLINAMKEKGIRAMADIVINHRCGSTTDDQGRWNVFRGGGQDPEGSICSKLDWGPWAIVKGDQFSDGSGQNDPSGENYHAAPNIDHRNPAVQESLIGWMQWLRSDIGYSGFRFDFVKGYGAEFVGKYVEASNASWSVGELWNSMWYDEMGTTYNQDGHRQQLADWVDHTGGRSAIFDFTTKGILQQAAQTGEFWRLRDSNSKPPGMIGWYPQRAVTFIDNHDTGSTQNHWPFPNNRVAMGYAYILTHPGIPSIFWDHVMDWGQELHDEIGRLLQARRRAGVKVDSWANINQAEQELYFATIGDDRGEALKVKLGSRTDHEVPNGNDWEQVAYGNDYSVWVKNRLGVEMFI